MPNFSASFEQNIIEQTVELENLESQSVEWRAGKVDTLRDENGNVILYEDPQYTTINVNRPDQYIALDFQERIFDTGEVNKVIDTDISELYSGTTIQSKVERFFSLFENLILQIPIQGDTSSLTYLLQRISEITNNQLVDPNLFSEISGSLGDLQDRFDLLSDLIGSLTAASSSLNFENKTLQQQIQTLAQVILDNLTGQKITIEELLALLNQGAGRIVSTPPVYGEVNTEYRYDIITNVDVSDWQMTAGPSWLELIELTSTQARLIGTPTVTGEELITIRAVGTGGTIYQTYNLIIQPEGTGTGGGFPSGYRVELNGALLAGTSTNIQIGDIVHPSLDYIITDSTGTILNEISNVNAPVTIAGLPYGSNIQFTANQVSITRLGGIDPRTGKKIQYTTIYYPVAWVRVSSAGVVTVLDSKRLQNPSYTFSNIDNDYQLYVLYSEII